MFLHLAPTLTRPSARRAPSVDAAPSRVAGASLRQRLGTAAVDVTGARFATPYSVHESRGGTWLVVGPEGASRHEDRAGAARVAVNLFHDSLLLGHLGFGVDDVRRLLRGRDLAYTCPTDQACHADVLLALANDAEAA